MEENALIREISSLLEDGNAEKASSMLNDGFKKFPKNYELYLLLAEYYLNKNNDLAFLCCENALFFAKKPWENLILIRSNSGKCCMNTGICRM